MWSTRTDTRAYWAQNYAWPYKDYSSLLRLAFGWHSRSHCLFVPTSTYTWISIRPVLTLLVARDSSLPDKTFIHKTHVNIETDRHCSIAIGTGWISRNLLLHVVDGALLLRQIFDVDKSARAKRSLENHTLENVYLLLKKADPHGVNTSIKPFPPHPSKESADIRTKKRKNSGNATRD